MADEKKKPSEGGKTDEPKDKQQEEKKQVPADNPKNKMEPRPLWESYEGPKRKT